MGAELIPDIPVALFPSVFGITHISLPFHARDMTQILIAFDKLLLSSVSASSISSAVVNQIEMVPAKVELSL